MNPRQNMIIAKGKIITSDVISCNHNLLTGKYELEFKNGKTYAYSHTNVILITNPKELNPSNLRIEHNNRELIQISQIFVFEDDNRQYWHICFRNGNEQDYKKSTLTINISSLSDFSSKNVFNYLKETANYVSLRASDGTKLLSKQYDKIEFIDKEKAFSTYVNPGMNPLKQFDESIPIFPFGCNASQFKAVKYALENQISIIQGPPGTGKTQTILNIIANLLITGKTVQIVSNNNSATANILDKLSSSEYNMGFLVAALGNAENKARFIERQTNEYPKIIQSWRSNISAKTDFFEVVRNHSIELNRIFKKQEILALVKHKLQELSVEYQHFKKYSNETGRGSSDYKFRKKLKSEKLLQLWRHFQYFTDNAKTPSFFFKFKCRFIYGLFEWSFFNQDLTVILTHIQSFYYILRQNELKLEINNIEDYLSKCNQKSMEENLTKLSIKYLRAVLYKRYGKTIIRPVFSKKDLWTNPKAVQNEYPIILSTTFSARSSLCKNAEFDYLIMDEASQVDVATGALALSCANNAVIVGDTQQLPNVVTSKNRASLQQLHTTSKISKNYNFVERSFLQSICEVIPNAPQTLLREHYRCHPKIINFCNKKFYDGKLVIMTRDNEEKNVISIFKTVVGNHQRDHMNQRQIDAIKLEVLPSIQYPEDEIGIIAPYRNQVKAMKEAINNKKIEINTVHKFQGREKNVIIISTVDNELTDFSDNPYLLNVAISRAKESLCIVVSGNEQPSDSNIRDLIDYIEYNNFTVVDSAIYSVFDLLYSQYSKFRFRYLKNGEKISKYDSENLMYVLINEVLTANGLFKLAVVCHLPLNILIRDTIKLNNEERSYALNSVTHLDFLIYNNISKKPILAIEVDGFHYHKEGTKQALRDKKKNNILELYGIPLLRFATNSSGEKEKLESKLKELLYLT